MAFQQSRNSVVVPLNDIEAVFFSRELLTATFVANSASSQVAGGKLDHKKAEKRQVRCEPENWESTVTAKQTTEWKPQRHKRVLERRSWFSSTFCFLLANRFSATTAADRMSFLLTTRRCRLVKSNEKRKQQHFGGCILVQIPSKQKNTWLFSHIRKVTS